MNTAEPVLIWTEQLATGVPEIDAEHQRLIDLINELGRLHQSQASAAELRQTLAELRDYTVYHFRTEAELMQRYPVDPAQRRSHLAAHGGFVQRLDSFDALLAAEPQAVVECLLAFMVDWLVHHVTGVDARLAREITALQGAAPVGTEAVPDSARHNALIDKISELHEGMGARTFELLQSNQRLRTEIEQRLRAEQELRLAAIVFDAVDEAVMVTDAENRIVRVNSSFTRITGFTAEDAIGANPRIMSGGTHNAEFYQGLWASLANTGKWQGEIRNRRKNGEFYVEWLSIYRVRDEPSGSFHHVAVFSDVTKQRVEADRIRYLANYDLLTGLPNRALFVERLRLAISAAASGRSKLAVMFADLDLFKAINDAHGHDVGDLLLRAAADRMQASLSEGDTVARLGGDEFVLLLPSIANNADALQIAERVRATLVQPFALAGHALRISGSIGVAIYPDCGTDELQLLKCADTAMYRAKEQGRNGVVWSGAADSAIGIGREPRRRRLRR
jgi:diguanylate cyclase (GGDEF)-like protein/hemerythrin-like metal-binding protein/PAS domain S-box-containing protein